VHDFYGSHGWDAAIFVLFNEIFDFVTYNVELAVIKLETSNLLESNEGKKPENAELQ
jgi:uncharacterized membrane protein